MSQEEFFKDFTQEIIARSGAEDNFTRTTFLEYMCSKLEDDGFISGFDLTEHKITSRGQAVDAWSYDDELSRLTLFIGDFRSSGNLENLTNKEISTLFKRLRRFTEAALKDSFAASLEEADSTASLARLIAESKDRIGTINLVILSNAVLSTRVAEIANEPIGAFQTTCEIWDFGRLYRSETSGKSREDVEIDISSLIGNGLPCLPAYTGTDTMQSYLVVAPGEVLAKLYDEYGERLLEQNVRTFLQFRGKINKGMRNTIVNEPQMFFSYNNGISATAEEVETSDGDSRLVRVKNLQIVNGGQTTASIFTAKKKENADLSHVYVQIKLSVIPPAQVEEIVPKISEYSNTQNKVNAADFFSNHPFHLRIEEFSRRLWAPSPAGAVVETHWFYERTRGQFANKQANLTAQQKKRFLQQHPRSQMFTKTDLAKYILSFEEAPDEVSLGAQKAFSGTPRTKGFVGRIAKDWEKNEKQFNEIWFKRAIAKAIFFRELDKLVFKQPWYGGGHKANIVTYTLSKLAALVRESGKAIKFTAVWEEQKLPEIVREQLVLIATAIDKLLHNPPEHAPQNPSEWAKKPDCWEAVRKAEMCLSEEFEEWLIHTEEEEEQNNEGALTQGIQNGIEAQNYVFEKGAEYWAQLREWNRMNHKLTGREMSILNIACSIPRSIPTDRQASILIQAEERAKTEGFYPG